MKIKKFLMYSSIVLALIFVIALGWLVSINKKSTEQEANEIIPAEEISDTQLRQTIVTLYFMDKATGNLEPEARQIDAKMLLENPYYILVNMLIEGPKSEQLIKILPDNTKLHSIDIENGVVFIDFSKDFIEEQTLGKEQEEKIINSIVKTLTNLREVNGIKILIDGQENLSFPDNELNFEQEFKLNK